MFTLSDEAYTRYQDIEKRLTFYKNHLKNRIVYCNCDDWTKSNFSKYFIANFHWFGLKELIVTGLCSEGIRYDGETIRRFELKDEYLIKGKNRKKIFDGGSFKSKQCLELMEESDCLITNPPFSLMREYARTIRERRKDFLIISDLMSMNSSFYQMMYYNEIWLPHTEMGRPAKFILPGNPKPVSIRNTTWMTNFGHREIYTVKLTKKFNDAAYHKFWNFDAINVDKVGDIPVDYFDWMGVPLNYMYQHDPALFDLHIRKYTATYQGEMPRVLGRQQIPRVIIRRARQNP